MSNMIFFIYFAIFSTSTPYVESQGISSENGITRNTTSAIEHCDTSNFDLISFTYCFCLDVTGRSTFRLDLLNHDLFRNIEYGYRAGDLRLHESLKDKYYQHCALRYLSKEYELHGVSIITNEEHQLLAAAIQDCEPSRLYSTHILQKSISTTHLRMELLALKSTGSKTFILLCDVEVTSLTLQVAVDLDMNDEEYVWIVLQLSVIFNGHPVPPNIMTITVTHRESHTSLTFPEKIKRTCEEKLADGSLERHLGKPLNKTKEPLKIEFIISVLNTDPTPNWVQVGTYEDKHVHFDREQLKYMNFFPAHHDVSARLKLKFATVLDKPYTMIHPHKEHVFHETTMTCSTGLLCWFPQKQNGSIVYIPECCYGYCIDIAKLIIHDLNIEPYIYAVPDGSYGAFVNGKWTGVVGEVHKRRADIGLAALTNTPIRGKYIDFPEPFLNGGLEILTIAKEDSVPFFAISSFEPLSISLWITTFGWVFLASFYLVLSENVLTYQNQNVYKWAESLSYVFGLMFQRDLGGKNPKNFNTRLLSIVIALSTMAIMSAYTAILTANKVTYQVEIPVTGFTDQKLTNPTNNFKFGTYRDSAYDAMFASSTDPTWRRMSQFMKNYNFRNSIEAVSKLKNGGLDAAIMDIWSATHHMSKDENCELQTTNYPLKDAGMSVAVAKGSPLKLQISELILNYQDDGNLKEIEKHWFENKCEESNRYNEGVASFLTIEYFGGLFTVMLFWIILALLTLAIEYFSLWIQRKDLFRCQSTTPRKESEKIV